MFCLSFFLSKQNENYKQTIILYEVKLNILDLNTTQVEYSEECTMLFTVLVYYPAQSSVDRIVPLHET